MPREWKRKSDSGSESDDGQRSRQRDRDDEPVVFRDVCPPKRLDKPGNRGFVEIARRETVGKESGTVKMEFFTIVPGYYSTKENDAPRYNKKSPSWPPSMTREIIAAIEDMVSDEEAKQFGWTD